jgi:hypothetical protein
MITEIEPFDSSDLTPSDFCLWGWMKSEVYKRKVDTPDELLSRILDVAASMKKREDRLRRRTRDLHIRVANALRLTVGFTNIHL